MSESTTSSTLGVAAAYNDDDLQVPGVAAYNENHLQVPNPNVAVPAPAPAPAPAPYNEEQMRAPGVRFVPWDHELIVDYLMRKLRGQPLVFPDVVHDGHDAYAEHPKKLVQKLGEGIKGSWYLFSPRQRKYPGGMRPQRAMRNDEGHWKATGAEKPIFGGKEVIGTQRALTFHEDTYEVGSNGRRRRVKNKSASKPSKWKMVEFVCINSCRLPGNNGAPDGMLLNDCVLCKITDRSVEGDEVEQPTADGVEPLTEQQQQQQQGSSSGGGAASHGNQQPAPADYGHDFDLGDVDWFADCTTTNMFTIYDDGIESLDAQTGLQQASSGGGGAGAAG